jgi:phosphatidylserine synthase
LSKLPKQNQFLDLSDYGRPVARVIAKSLKGSWVTPVHVTVGFIISGLLAIVFMLNHQYWIAALFLILKSILDAADGELARMNDKPSYIGRYLDSVSDIILNFLILITIWHITKGSIATALLAFFAIQLQGTLYNYYCVILRNKYDGDKTSRIIENQIPIAMHGESQRSVTILFKLYTLLYGVFDKIIYNLDKNAAESKYFPNWFMTAVSTFGLGFQLLIISIMLILHLENYIFLFFIAYSIFILLFIIIRKIINQ